MARSKAGDAALKGDRNDCGADRAPGYPGILRLIAPNPSPMTGKGTNTYLYRRRSKGMEESVEGGCVVIDPGVDERRHLEAIAAAGERLGGITAVLISHDHPDHIGGADYFGVPVLHPADGEVVGGLRALATPGHADDHLCFVADHDGPILFSADLILGEGSTFVQPGGGSLIAYMRSLRLVREVAPVLICPGHGPWITDPIAKIDEYIEHRMMRERNLVDALGRGLRGRDALLDDVWHDAAPELRDFASLVLQAHLEKLEIEGRLPVGESIPDILN
jgi:glyoxylase-like metal-dependent hydrolase (beta-lactamase superfamily II)